HPEQRGLACAVRTDEPRLLALLERGGGFDEQDLVALLFGNIVEADHGHAREKKSSRPLLGHLPHQGKRISASMPLEILHGALVLFGGRTRFERAEIAPSTGLRIDLARIEPVLAGLQLADHGMLPRYPSSQPSPGCCVP